MSSSSKQSSTVGSTSSAPTQENTMTTDEVKPGSSVAPTDSAESGDSEEKGSTRKVGKPQDPTKRNAAAERACSKADGIADPDIRQVVRSIKAAIATLVATSETIRTLEGKVKAAKVPLIPPMIVLRARVKQVKVNARLSPDGKSFLKKSKGPNAWAVATLMLENLPEGQLGMPDAMVEALKEAKLAVDTPMAALVTAKSNHKEAVEAYDAACGELQAQVTLLHAKLALRRASRALAKGATLKVVESDETA